MCAFVLLPVVYYRFLKEEQEEEEEVATVASGEANKKHRDTHTHARSYIHNFEHRRANNEVINYKFIYKTRTQLVQVSCSFADSNREVCLHILHFNGI